LKGELFVETNLPSSARIVVNRQEEETRTVIHLLYGNTVTRGGGMNLVGGVGGDGTPPRTVEVIETLLPLRDVEFKIKMKKPGRVFLEPQHLESDYYDWQDGVLTVRLDGFTCHQMVVLED
jgi:hypothetical protein